MASIIATLRAQALAAPARIAVDGGSGRLSYVELERRIDEFSKRLAHYGCRVVGLLADNGIDWVVADLAALASGCTLVPIPPYFSETQLDHVIAASGIDTLLVADETLAAGAATRGFDAVHGGREGLRLLRRPGREPAVGESPVAKITFTSGSTGEPKGVCLSADTIGDVAARLCDVVTGIAAERHLCVMPLATLLENIAGVYVPLLRGATVHVPPLDSLGVYGSSRLEPERLRATIDTLQIESLIVQPELLRALSSAYRQAGERSRSLKFVAVGGARVTDDDLDDARATGIPAYQGYGLSECASVVALSRPGDSRPGSVGRPLPGITIDFSPDGEILVGKQCMEGYVGEARNGPTVHTGDLGHLDEDGFLYVTGRAKHVFITSFGRNVSPEWPESELLHEEGIAHACVFGEGRPVNTAVIVPANVDEDGDAIANAIRRANRRLPDYARIDDWIVATDGFSRSNGLLTATGKPRREAVALRFLLGDGSESSTRADAVSAGSLTSIPERTPNEIF